MRINNLKKLKSKKLLVFDIDGTLAPTKSAMDQEMSDLLTKLLTQKKVAVIGGGKYELFKMQLIDELKTPKSLLKDLYLFPTTATSFYRYDKGWKRVYYHKLSKAQVAKIKKAFDTVFQKIGYQHPKKTYGVVIEDRGTQVTFSALGQDVVAKLGKKGIALKDKWKKENTPLKLKIGKMLRKHLPEFDVGVAGYTSIDVTKKGIDKAYGLRQIEKILHIKIKDMVFVGDAIFPGGNDYAVTKTKVDYVPVDDPEGAKKVIRAVLE